jgi:DNA mismatch repair ATPase MutS
MDPYVNNFVLSVHIGANNHLTEGSPSTDAATILVGLAWLDLSTGKFYTQSSSLSTVSAVIARLSPKEVILDKSSQAQLKKGLLSMLEEEGYLVTYSTFDTATISSWSPMLESEIEDVYAAEFTSEEVTAGSALLNYVKDRLQGLNMKLQPPVRHHTQDVMGIDKNSMRALEIKETIRDRVGKGSLLNAMRRTVTKSGARLLHDWLSMTLLLWLWRQTLTLRQHRHQLHSVS